MLLPSATRIRQLAVVDSLAGAQTNRAPSVASVAAALDAKADLVAGKVPSSQLPSFVDDVLEYADQSAFPGTGETSKIYVALDTGKLYRWSGSAYVEISPSPGSTDSVTEGATNKYYTAARAKADAVVNSVGGSQTDQAPSVASIVAALLLKAAAIHSHSISDVNLLQDALDAKLAGNGSGANLTSLNADQITTGTLAAARLASGSHAKPVEVSLANDLALVGTSNQDLLTLNLPSTGLWVVEWQAAFNTSTSQTFTTRLITGTAAIAGATGRAVGCGFAGTAVALCTITTGSPTIVSGRASSGLNTAQVVHLVLDVQTAGTFVLQVAPNNGGGSPVCQAGAVIYGVKL